MAYTKIIKVKSNLNLCLDYTSNPMKTERRSAEDLNKLLNYTQNNDKTEHQLYVSGFNCIPQNAYIDPRPSVRATIMALKKAARAAAQAQEKVQDITAKEER